MPADHQDLVQCLELVADYGCDTAEGPLWHPFEKRLYWTDIPTGRIFRYDPATSKHEQCYSGRAVGGFTIQHDGALLLFMDRGTVAEWREGSLTYVIEHIEAELETRFNDVIADPEGRVFCGTLSGPKGKGRLYRLDLDGSLHLLLEEIGCANGMAFSRDRRTFYFIDSFAYTVYAFDYNQENGAISNQHVFATFPDSMGFPDGCTIDSENRLWVAVWGSSAIVRLNKDGTIAEMIATPMKKPTSITFAGDDYRDLYITSEGGRPKVDDDPLAGTLFCGRSRISGVPEYLSRVVTGVSKSAPR